MFDRLTAILCMMVVAALWLLSPYGLTSTACAAASCGDCPPLYCEDPAAAKKAKDKKARAAESQGLPKRLSKLFYQLPDCVGCVQMAPDWVTIAWEVDQDAMEKLRGSRVKYDRHWEPWSAELEWKLRQQIEQGLVKEVHFMVQGGSRCRCCKPGHYKEFRYKIGQDAKDARRVDKGESVGGYNTDFEYYKPYGKKLTNPSDYPKDLNEVPEGLRYPDSIKMPPLRMEPAERNVTQPCKECKGAADAYNDTVNAFNNLRRPLAKAQQSVAFYAKVNAYAWRAYSATRFIADPAAREKEEAKALDLYRVRMQQWEDAKREYAELKQKRDGLKATLKQQFAALLACEEQCRKPKPKPKVDHSLGGDFEIELEDVRSTSGTNAFDPKAIEDLHQQPEGGVVRGGGITPVEDNKPFVPSGSNVKVEEPKIEYTPPGSDKPVVEPPKVVTPPPPPPTPPLQVSASGSINFTHVVRESPCPQAAGSISVSINTGNDFEIVSAKAMGAIASKLNVQIQGKKVVVQFNCSSPDNGTFTGAIAITVRDKKTGKTASAPSVAAKGTVTGP